MADETISKTDLEKLEARLTEKFEASSTPPKEDKPEPKVEELGVDEIKSHPYVKELEGKLAKLEEEKEAAVAEEKKETLQGGAGSAELPKLRPGRINRVRSKGIRTMKGEIGLVELPQIIALRHQLLTFGFHISLGLFHAISTLLVTRAAVIPLVVVLDDLHAADQPTLLMLRFLAQELGRAPMLVVGAYRDVGISPRLPLAEALAELMSAGFEAVVVVTNGALLDESWLGRRVDERLIEDLAKLEHDPPIDPCGENGEFHTLVVHGPLFSGRLEVTEAVPVQRKGYWFLDIRGYRVGS